MAYSINQAQPPLGFIPPKFNQLLWRGTKLLMPAWIKTLTSISEIKAENLETLVDLYRQYQEQNLRFLIAFRHPSADDSYSMAYLLWYLVPKMAKKLGISLKSPIHAHFIYDRGIPLWAGNGVGWIYSNLGGTPIYRGKVDRIGLRSARDLFAHGRFPMAAAPEGATNGHNEIVSPIEPGIAQLGFWCVEDIQKDQRPEKVIILPLGIKYSYVSPPWDAIENLLQELETDIGLSASENNLYSLPITIPAEINDQEANLYRRLLRVGIHVVSIMEDFYTRFYHQKLPDDLPQLLATSPDLNTSLEKRLPALLDIGLKVAEQYFNIPAKGSFIDRCRRLEQAGWDRIFREDIKSLETLSPLEKGLADRIAEESSLRMWHMRLVESFVAVTGQYVREKPTAERFAETTLLLWDVVARIKAGNPFKRPCLGKQKVKITIGEPISVSQRWDDYQNNRRKAVSNLTKDLQTALEKML